MRRLLLSLIICAFAIPAHAQYSGGSGTADDLIVLGETPDDDDEHFKLIANIGPSEYPGRAFNITRLPGTPFRGTVDGNGHTILNFVYHANDTHRVGLFTYASEPSAEIKNLGGIDRKVGAADGLDAVSSTLNPFSHKQGQIEELYNDYPEGKPGTERTAKVCFGRSDARIPYSTIGQYGHMPSCDHIAIG